MRKEYYNGCLRMKKYIKSYIDYVDDVLNNNKKVNYKKFEEEHLIKISFFQHERLVHLLVTLFYALFLVLFIFLSIKEIVFTIVSIILLILLLFYVSYYFWLENNVQYLYKQYDEIVDRRKKSKLF